MIRYIVAYIVTLMDTFLILISIPTFFRKNDRDVKITSALIIILLAFNIGLIWP